MLNQNDYVTPRSNYQLPNSWTKVMKEADTCVRRGAEDGNAAPMHPYRLQKRNERMAAYPNLVPGGGHAKLPIQAGDAMMTYPGNANDLTTNPNLLAAGGQQMAPGSGASFLGGAVGIQQQNVNGSPHGSPNRKDYQNSQLPDSKGYFSGNTESGPDVAGPMSDASSDPPRGYARSTRSADARLARRQVKTPAGWAPSDSIRTPALQPRPVSPRLKVSSQTTRSTASPYKAQRGDQRLMAGGSNGFVPREIPPARGNQQRINIGSPIGEIHPRR